MRLSTIKLSGFKSFVDPTTLHLPNNMTGIVRPHGCGKSNIIHAVRWVMGESSASRLRGDSLTDVIFAGSSARKPVRPSGYEDGYAAGLRKGLWLGTLITCLVALATAVVLAQVWA